MTHRRSLAHGLVAALEWQAEEFERRTGTRCQARSSLDEVVLARDASTVTRFQWRLS